LANPRNTTPLALAESATVPLTTAQLQALKADIAADATLAALAKTADNAFAIADAYNRVAAPDYYVWRTNVTEAEYVGTGGVDVANGGATTTWSWTAFIARTVGEQTGWERMFAPGWVNPSQANIRQGVSDIFSGNTTAATAQRNHLTVLSKRKATRAEKLFASGTGAFATPSTLVFEGALTYNDVLAAWQLGT
jgi:hypothetical protein